MKTLAASLAILLVIAGFVWINFSEGKTPVDGASEISALKTEAEQSPMTQAALSFLDGLTEEQKEEFIQKMTAAERNAYIANMSDQEKARYYAEKDLFKTVNIIKGWLNEVEEEEEG